MVLSYGNFCVIVCPHELFEMSAIIAVQDIVIGWFT